ncbi:MAG: hypothetical protein IKW26_10365 [Treponema sp.]|nr:hypothetical protein [Treponema sp.]
MKKIAICLVACVCLAMSSFAQSAEEIPTWIKNSIIILSEQAYGSPKTIGDLFGGKRDSLTTTKITYSDKEFVITNMMGDESFYFMKMKITFVMTKMGNAGTCWPSNVLVESPLTGQTINKTCYGSPYDNPRAYGEIMGLIASGLDTFYE